MRRNNIAMIPEESPLSVDNVIESLSENILSIPFGTDEDEVAYVIGVIPQNDTEIKLEMSDGTEFIIEVRQTK